MSNSGGRKKRGKLQIRVLGGFEAMVPDGSPLALPAKARALVAYLAIRPGTFHLRDKLAALLWGDSGDRQARDSLRHALRAIGAACTAADAGDLLSEGQAFAVDPATVAADATEFEAAAAAGTPAAWTAAASLYRGALLEGLTVDAPGFEEWLLGERERFRHLAIEVHARLLAHRTSLPPTSETLEAAAATARRLLALDPVDESVHRALMRLYVHQERRGTALRHYQRCVATLRHELGTEPEAETRRLYEDILQRRVPDVPRPRVARQSPRAIERPADAATAVIGREAEREALRSAVGNAARGAGHVVTILGESGIGKSTLLRLVGDGPDPAATRHMPGRSHASTRMLPFAPWIDALRSGGVTADDEAVAALDPVWRAQVARLLPELGPTPPGRASVDPASLFEGVAQLARSFAQRDVLIVTLEDIHWADDMSLRLIAFLARRLPAWRMLLAVTARSDTAGAPLLGPVLDEVRQNAHATSLRLGPLSPAETMALAALHAPPAPRRGAPAWLGGRIWAISRGNPHVAVEATRAIGEAMADTIPPSMSDPLEPQPTSEGVRGLIEARLSRLSDAAHQVVEIAAVVDHALDFTLLRHACGQPQEVTAAAVEELVRRGVLEASGESLAFTHDRIREVAYARTLSGARERAHRTVARSIEAVCGESAHHFSTELASHYERAGEWGAAAAWLQRAALVMAVRAAYAESAAALGHAHDLLTRLPATPATEALQIDLWLDRRNVHLAVGELQPAADALIRAERLARAAGDVRRLARILGHMAHDAWLTGGGYPVARSYAERALAVTAGMDDPALQAEAAFFLGSTCVCGGDYARAVEVLSASAQALSGPLATERFGLPYTPSCVTLAWLAWAYADLGRSDEALALLPRIDDVARLADDAFSHAAARLTRGLVLVRTGRAADAVAPLTEAVDACARDAIHLLLPYAGGHLGLALAHAGREAEGAAVLEGVVQQARNSGFVAYLSRWVGMLGEAQMRAGQLDAAAASAAEALTLARRYDERGNEAWALWLLAALAAAGGADADARRLQAEASTIAETLGMRPLVEVLQAV